MENSTGKKFSFVYENFTVKNNIVKNIKNDNNSLISSSFSPEKEIYRGEQFCQSKMREGPCYRKAIYVWNNRLTCSIHRNRKYKIFLPLKPVILINKEGENIKEIYRNENPCEENDKCQNKAEFLFGNKLLCKYHKVSKLSVKLPLNPKPDFKMLNKYYSEYKKYFYI